MKDMVGRVWLFVFVALFAVSWAFGEKVDWVNSYDEAVALASTQGRFIVADVCVDWSPACRELDENVFTDPRFIAFSRSQVFMQIRADRDIRSEWMAGQFRVRAYPTILVLDPQGDEIDRLIGALSSSRLMKFLQMVFDTPLRVGELNDRAEAHPDDLKLQTAAGRRAAGRGDFKEAQPFLMRALELADPHDIDTTTPLLSDLVQASYSNHDFEETLRGLDRLYAIDPSARQDVSLKLLRGRALVERDRDREAYDLIVPLLDAPEEWVRRQARDVFDDLPKELRRDIEEREDLEKDVTEDLRKQKFQDAKEGAQRLLSVRPNDGRIHVQLAEALFGLQEAAPSGTEDGSLLERAYDELRLGRRLSLDDEDTYETALRLTQVFHGLRSEPADRKARKEFEKAEKDFAAQRYRRAEERYRKVLEAEPEFGMALRRLGNCLLFRGQVQAALRQFLMATKANPNDAAAYRLAADAFGRLDQTTLTWEAYRQSLLADPDFPGTWRDLEAWGEASGEGFERHAAIVPVRLLIPSSRQQAEGVLASLPEKTRPAWKAYLDCQLERRERKREEGASRLADAGEQRTCLERAVKVWDGLKSEDRSLEDDNLDFLRQIWIDGQLDSFVYLELYTEEYRPSFEAWKSRNRPRALRYLQDYVFGQAQAAARAGYNSSAVKAFDAGAALHDSEPGKALEFYRQALRQERYMLPALENACDIYFGLQQYDEALDYLRRWRELQPESGRALHMLAFVFIQHEEYADALPLLHKAAELEKDPDEKARIEENIRFCEARLEVPSG